MVALHYDKEPFGTMVQPMLRCDKCPIEMSIGWAFGELVLCAVCYEFAAVGVLPAASEEQWKTPESVH